MHALETRRPRCPHRTGGTARDPLVGRLLQPHGRPARRADHQQRRFIADASHQLRSPLAALRLRLEAIDPADPEGSERHIEAAVEEVGRLSRLVDGLLEIARVEGTRPQRSAVDVGAVLRDRVEMWEALAEERDVHLEVAASSDDLAAVAVPGHLEQILDNLLANALEVAPARSAIELQASRRSVDGRQLLAVDLDDAGPGMTEQQRHVAFTRFWQDDTQPTGTTGLGLAISRQLARASGGDLTLDVSPCGGLRATVLLEPQRRAAGTTGMSPAPRPVIRLALRHRDAAARLLVAVASPRRRCGRLGSSATTPPRTGWDRGHGAGDRRAGCWVVPRPLRRRLGVDVLALLALVGTLVVGEYLAGAVITVMLASGRTLEALGGRPGRAGAARAARRGRRGSCTATTTASSHAAARRRAAGDLLLVQPARSCRSTARRRRGRRSSTRARYRRAAAGRARGRRRGAQRRRERGRPVRPAGDDPAPRAPTPASCGWSRRPRRRARRSCGSPTATPASSSCVSVGARRRGVGALG